jgi:hypothetical protein
MTSVAPQHDTVIPTWLHVDAETQAYPSRVRWQELRLRVFRSRGGSPAGNASDYQSQGGGAAGRAAPGLSGCRTHPACRPAEPLSQRRWPCLARATSWRTTSSQRHRGESPARFPPPRRHVQEARSAHHRGQTLIRSRHPCTPAYALRPYSRYAVTGNWPSWRAA